ncbi:MAG: DmsC/YnfH family molybdoenzyme membrane anchor subunit [Isosphaeraceae bacterium]
MNLIEWDRSTPALDREWTPAGTLPGDGLLGAILERQRDLSAVERFAQFHAEVHEPLQGRYYASLLPARPPSDGQQYAFEVDLDRCSGCKACVAACHNLNGLDEGESWREVGLVVGGSINLPVLQHVTSSCHHCLDPACAAACPVDAYEKDPVTGIVRHLDDQCIGCQYCTLACPYDAPKFQPSKGIVRKCDMCAGRLAAGEAPACVQACPHEAIVIRIVDRSDVNARAEADDFLAGAPDPLSTRPTTVYHSTRLDGMDEVRPADDEHFQPEHAHWPLIVMLVLTQFSVGGFAVDLAATTVDARHGLVWSIHDALALTLGLAGLVASVLHLGRPLYAYRAIIGLRHSWLSREVLAFGIFAGLAKTVVALDYIPAGWLPFSTSARPALLAAVVAAGLAGIGSSVMVYHVVRRPFWHARFAAARFLGTALSLGLTTALAAMAIARAFSSDATLSPAFWTVALGLAAATWSRLRLESRQTGALARSGHVTLRKTAFLLRGPLRQASGLRRSLALAGGTILPAFAVLTSAAGHPGTSAFAAVFALVVSIAAEIAERYLFFTAVVRPGMPGRILS